MGEGEEAGEESCSLVDVTCGVAKFNRRYFLCFSGIGIE